MKEWLESFGLGKYSEQFITNDINGAVLINIEDEDLTEELCIKSKLHRKTILKELEKLKGKEEITEKERENLVSGNDDMQKEENGNEGNSSTDSEHFDDWDGEIPGPRCKCKLCKKYK